MELNIEKKKNPAEPDWNITVSLTKAERQKLLELLSLDTAYGVSVSGYG